MAEVPKVPKQIALFQENDYAGMDPNPGDVNPVGQPFASGAMNPMMGAGMPGMPGMPPFAAPPNPLMAGQQGMGPGPMMQGPPMPGGQQVTAQPMPMPGGQQGMGQPMPMPGPMPPNGMPSGGMPPPGGMPMIPGMGGDPMMGGAPDLMQQAQAIGQLGGGGPPPPPGAAANSRGPIGRMVDFMRQSYQADPQRYLLMMSAVASGNPNMATQMGQQFYQGQQAQEIKREEIDAMREYKRDQQDYRTKYRFDTKIGKLHDAARRDGIPSEDYMDEGQGEIPDEEGYERSRYKLDAAIATRRRDKRRGTWLKDVATGSISSTKGSEWEGDEETEREVTRIRAEFDDLNEMRQSQYDISKTRLDILKKQLNNVKDEGKRAELQLIYKRMDFTTRQIAALQGSMRRQREGFDIAGLAGEYQNGISQNAMELERLTNAAINLLGSNPFGVVVEQEESDEAPINEDEILEGMRQLGEALK